MPERARVCVCVCVCVCLNCFARTVFYVCIECSIYCIEYSIYCIEYSMYDVGTPGVDERMINVHYYYY